MEEALAGLRRTLGAEHEDTLKAMGDLAHYYGGTMEERQNGSTRTFQVAMGRQLNEGVAETMRRSSPGHGPTTINAMMANSNLGANLAGIGDIGKGLAMMQESAANARQVLGEAHPITQQMAERLAAVSEAMAELHYIALGTLVGLSRPELNNQTALVVGFDGAKGRYRVRAGATADRNDLPPLGIKPANLFLNDGTAVIVEGFTDAPEWNGRRGLVHSYDRGQKQYKLLVKGRERPLSVGLDRCRLESVVLL
jgi:hypothetical protein